MSHKLVVVCTTGPEDPEKATLSFVMATAAQASDIPAVMIFQAGAVSLVKRGVVDSIRAENFPPLADLVEAFFDMGGSALVCGPCAKTRGVSASNMVEGARIANAMAQMAEIVSATNVLNY